MTNPWKLATIGILALMGTALTTGLTIAYLMPPTADVVEPTAAAPTRHVVSATYRPAPARSLVQKASYPVASTAASTPEDCATGADRAWRIAKPGLLGTLLGAGLGAAGGAVADGGDGAGKGALIGGLTGAALGTGYGTYNTKTECGTIFGRADAATTVSSAR